MIYNHRLYLKANFQEIWKTFKKVFSNFVTNLLINIERTENELKL